MLIVLHSLDVSLAGGRAVLGSNLEAEGNRREGRLQVVAGPRYHGRPGVSGRRSR